MPITPRGANLFVIEKDLNGVEVGRTNAAENYGGTYRPNAFRTFILQEQSDNGETYFLGKVISYYSE
jgi:hypothetical protein